MVSGVRVSVHTHTHTYTRSCTHAHARTHTGLCLIVGINSIHLDCLPFCKRAADVPHDGNISLLCNVGYTSCLSPDPCRIDERHSYLYLSTETCQFGSNTRVRFEFSAENGENQGRFGLRDAAEGQRVALLYWGKVLWKMRPRWWNMKTWRCTHMSVMLSISGSLCRTGNVLIPRSGSTQEIRVLLQMQENGHASADSHGSPEPTATPTTITHHHQQHRHDQDPLPGGERAPLPGLQALISGANFSYKARWTAPAARPRLAGISPGSANQGGGGRK